MHWHTRAETSPSLPSNIALTPSHITLTPIFSHHTVYPHSPPSLITRSISPPLPHPHLQEEIAQVAKEVRKLLGVLDHLTYASCDLGVLQELRHKLIGECFDFANN